MYRISITTQFSAAHFLRNYKGKCESLHGHNWKVEVTASANQLDELGMVVDFSRLKEITRGILETMDHKNLNDIAYFASTNQDVSNPSSEEIARFLFVQLKKEIETPRIRLNEVRVWETDSSSAAYSE